MQKSERIEKMKKVKNIVNEIINVYVHQPRCIYTGIIAKNYVDLICCSNKLIKLSCHVWQDMYFHELENRARLDVWDMTGEGEHIYLFSCYPTPSEREIEEDRIPKPDEEFQLIEKVISNLNEIRYYYKKRKELEMESCDISPGSPRSKLNSEFYSRDWTI